MFKNIKEKWIIIGYAIAILFFALAWIRWDINFLRILSLCFFILVSFIQIAKVKESKSEKFLSWYYFFISVLLLIAYTLLIVFNKEVGAFMTIGATIFLIILLSCGLIFYAFYKSNSIINLVINYLFLSLATITLFSFFFIAISFVPNSQLEWATNNSISSNSQVIGIWSLMYFSASVFYVSAFGDIVPMGFSRLTVIVEIVISFILHSIIIGKVIADFKKKK